MTKKTTTKEKDIPSGTGAANNLIAVASGKGGVGKTWFSITLCHALAKQGKKVLLFDGDLGLANVDVQLGLMTKHDLNDVIQGKLSLERVIHHYEEGGFDIIAGRSGQASLATIPLQHLNEILQQIRSVSSKYDYIIMDLGAGVERTVRFLASAASETLLVTNDEPTALTDAYAFIKLSHAAGCADTIRLVINLVSNDKEGEKTYNSLLKASKNFLHIEPPLAGMIHKDINVREAIRTQSLFLTRSPASQTAGDIEEISKKVFEKV